MKLILGFCGHLSVGKGTACQYLEARHGAKTVMFSQSMRDVLKRLHLDISRPNLQKTSLILREGFGQDLFAQVVAADADKTDSELVCVDGMRRPKDLEHLKKLPNFYLISLVADQKLRWRRMISRSQNNDDSSKTFEQFKKEDNAEPESLIDEIAQTANFVIDNNGDLDSLYQQIEKIYRSVNK